jgi:hypothetical protein
MFDFCGIYAYIQNMLHNSIFQMNDTDIAKLHSKGRHHILFQE